MCIHIVCCVQVAPRVAMAALAMKEDRDARKSVRDLFSAGVCVCVCVCVRELSKISPALSLTCSVLSVFSTPVASGSESRSEIDHKQLQLRYSYPHCTHTLLNDVTILFAHNYYLSTYHMCACFSRSQFDVLVENLEVM